MLDIKLIRENPEVLTANLIRRGAEQKAEWVKQAGKLDEEYRKLLFNVQEMRAERNKVAREVAAIKGKKGNAVKEIERMGRISNDMEKLEADIEERKKQINNILMRLPNLLHESVPKGRGEGDNVVIREWGKRKEPVRVKSHVDVLTDLGIGDIERAGKISGARFYFLKKELVLLDLALARLALETLRKKGFTLIETPLLMRRGPYEGVTDLGAFEDVLYKVEGEDLYLIATSEHPIAAMHMGEVLNEKDMPLLYAGWSACFRKEAGAHGKDTKGIFRVHQFNKVEQFVFSRPEESWEWHEKLIKNAEEIFQKLGLAYRIVNVCTGDIGDIAAKKYDLEVWMPAQKAYREAVSCSNCTDYQARRLNVRYGTEGEKPKGFVHTLNSTAIATTRAIVAILENCQQPDGTVAVPKVLHEYMGGIKTIGERGRGKKG